jgi:hypothetical protein
MGAVKTLLGVVILLAIIGFGYWLYATYTMASADDKMWVEVNRRLPSQLRKWSCETVNARIRSEQSPDGCDEFWKKDEVRSDFSRPIISIERPTLRIEPARPGN